MSGRGFGTVLACLCLAGVTSCASGPGAGRGSSGSPFPSRAQVDALTHGTGAISPFAQAVVDADEWTFVTPAATELRDEAYVPQTSWGKLLAEYVATDPGRLSATRALDCAAHEYASFYLAYSAMPATPLRAAMLGHCGALTGNDGPQYVFGPAAPDQTDEVLRYAWSGETRKLLYGPHPNGRLVLGLAFARDDRKAVVVLAVGVRRAEIERGTRAVDAKGLLSIHGRLLEPGVRLQALVNQGRFGVAECAPDPQRSLPEFGYTCALGPGDRSGHIMLAAHESGRLLGKDVLDVEAFRNEPAAGYQRVRYTDPAHVRDVNELPTRLVALVNEMRKEAGLAAVSLSKGESETATQLAPRYFEAIHDASKQQEADVITLGLLAGWDVGCGAIRDARFAYGLVGPTDDASQWVSSIMADPAGRAVLTDPSIRTLAFGSYMPPAVPMIGATVTGYAFFDSADYAGVRKSVLGRITAARAERGLPPPVVVTTLDGDAAELAAQLSQGRTTPTSALNQLLETGAKVLGRSVRGLAFEGNSDAIPVPDEFLSSKHLELSVTVSHYQPKDESWGRYVVLFVMPGEGTRA